MAWDYNKSNSDDNESSVNVQYGWAQQICQMLQAINSYNINSAKMDYSCLNNLFACLVGLVDFVRPKITTGYLAEHNNGKSKIEGDKGIDERIKSLQEELRKFEKLLLNYDLQSNMLKRRKGERIYNDLRKLYALIMEELSHHGILQYVKMNIKDMARQQWYGDAKGND